MKVESTKPCFIIILNYKKWDETLECLRSVFLSSWPHFKVIVVDNASGNRSLEQLSGSLAKSPLQKAGAGATVYPVRMDRQSFSAADPLTLPDLVFIQNDRNTGFAGGNNVALSCLVRAEAYILLLNPDMTVDPNALDEMVRLAGREPGAVIGSVHRSFNDPGMTIQYGGARVNYWSGNTSFIRTPQEVDRIDYISGGCLLADAAVYRAVGILPEDYFLYWEETDWCYRAREKGFSMRVCAEAITFDKRSTTIGNGFLAEYFYTRNGLLFLKKYKRRYLFTAFVLVIARVAKKLVLGQPARAGGMIRGVIDFVTGRKYENQ